MIHKIWLQPLQQCFTRNAAHLSVSFSFSLWGREAVLSEGDANFPPIYVRLEREKEEVSDPRVKHGDERGGGNATDGTGCRVNNG